MPVTQYRRLKYDELFTDNPLNFNDYFNGMGKDTLLKAIGLLINAASPDSEFHRAEDLINRWFNRNNSQTKQQLLLKLRPKDGITNIISSLQLAEYVLQTEFNNNDSISEDDFEINLFKAYLLLNTKQNELEESGYIDLPPEENTEERLLAIFLAQNYHDYDLSNYEITEILFCQLAKSIEFFKYLESRDELSPHLSLFLSKYHCDSWQTWLKQYLALVLPIIQVSDKSYFDYTLREDEHFEINSLFLDSFSLSDQDMYALPDFITLRSNPLMKLQRGRYRITSKLFLVEKLFKSIQFQFSIEINSQVVRSERIRDFRADYCDKFSEKVLLYRFVRNSLPKKWLSFSGQDFVDKGYEAEPDFYARFKNKILLFESKDVILKGDEKQSRNYRVLKRALSEKFYEVLENGTVQKKAIHQLIKNIKRILERYYIDCDANYNPDYIRIYPIIVVHDRQFDSLGVNKLLSMWFRSELANLRSVCNLSNVQELTVINIDTLLLYQEAFKNRSDCKIEQLIIDYHQNIAFDRRWCHSASEFEMRTKNSLRPFSDFSLSILDRKNLKMPSYIQDYIREIFPQ